MTLFKHAFRRSFKEPINIIILFLLPIGFIFIPKNNANTFPFGIYIYGYAIFFSAFLLCKPIIEDRTNKTIIRISATPTTYLNYLTSHLFAYVLILLIQNIIFLLGVYIYWNDAVNNYGLLLFIYFIFNLFSISFSLFWNIFFKNYQISMGLFSGASSIMCLLGGLTIPIHLFPEKMRNILPVLPTYWLSYGLNQLYSNMIQNYLYAVLILFIFSAIFLLIGSKRRF